VVGLSACGGSAADSSKASGGNQGARQVIDSARPPKVKLPPGPAPKHLVVHDLKVGSGPAIPAGKQVGVRTNYVSYSYRTGKRLELRWAPTGGAFNVEFGPNLVVEGWEKGLVGMKVGGRRELEVPSRMAYGEGSIFYLVDLLEVEKTEGSK
jgi:peptidylprolyl isomerase